MPPLPFRYTSADEDSGRWVDFPMRDGDIVISTRSKSGTTWMQMVCALLVFQTPELPAPLSELSPWLDWLVEDRDVLFARLAAQRHRRFIKTHTPLDGIPIDGRASYIVVGRHPLDSAVSLYHQGANLDRQRLRELTGAVQPPASRGPRPSLHDWLVGWIAEEVDPRQELDSLPGVIHHLSDAWARRSSSNMLLVRYDDLVSDLHGAMRRLADQLGILVPEATWPALVEAASFQSMRARASELAPDPSGILLDQPAFFRRGTPGAGVEVLTDGELARYHRRESQLATPDLLAWLHGTASEPPGRPGRRIVAP